MNIQLLNWKITAIVCTLILSGTALFIYEDFKADQLRQRQQAEAPQNKRELSDEDVYGTTAAATAKRQQNLPGYDVIEPEVKVPVSTLKPAPNIFDQFDKAKPDPILAEMRRANDIAERNSFQQELNAANSFETFRQHQQLNDLIWLQSLQANDLRRIREIYERQEWDQSVGRLQTTNPPPFGSKIRY